VQVLRCKTLVGVKYDTELSGSDNDQLTENSSVTRDVDEATCDESSKMMSRYVAGGRRVNESMN